MLVFTALSVAPGAAGAQGVLDELDAGAGVVRTAKPAKSGRAVDIGNLQSAWTDICARSVQQSPGVKVYKHKRQAVFCIDVRDNMPANLFLPAWENIVEMVNGDPSAFKVVWSETPELKGRKFTISVDEMTGADTSMVLTGSPRGAGEGDGRWKASLGGRNTYTFVLRAHGVDAALPTDLAVFIEADREPAPDAALPPESSAGEPGGGEPGTDGSGAPARGEPQEEEIKRMSWRGLPAMPSSPRPSSSRSEPRVVQAAGNAVAPSRASAEAPGAEPDWLREIPFDISRMRFNDYAVGVQDAAAQAIAPIRVFHDGTYTFLDFGEDGRSDAIRKPVVSEVVDGVDNPVNFTWTGPRRNIMAIQAVRSNFTLQNGMWVVCISYTGPGV